MPMKPSGETKHSRRNVVVRERVRSVIAKLEPTKPDKLGSNGLTIYGVFARRCIKIAEEYGGKWHKDGGAWSVKRFALGKQDAYGDALDIMEMACMEFEREMKEQAKIIPIREDVHEEVAVAQTGTTDKIEDEREDDPELAAMAAVIRALEPITDDKDAMRRVINYALDRMGVSL